MNAQPTLAPQPPVETTEAPEATAEDILALIRAIRADLATLPQQFHEHALGDSNHEG